MFLGNFDSNDDRLTNIRTVKESRHLALGKIFNVSGLNCIDKLAVLCYAISYQQPIGSLRQLRPSRDAKVADSPRIAGFL